MTAPMRAAAGRLREHWYAAALVGEVRADKPVLRTILGERIALWRGPDGAPRALHDRCLHRNASLAGGVIVDDELLCPYHGWAYDQDGVLTRVPSAGPDGAQALKCKLEAFPTCDKYGLVWVWMGARKAPSRDPFPIPHHGEPGWDGYYMVTPFENDVTNLVENFMDVPHTVFVHEGWFRTRAKKRVDAIVERTPDSVLVTYDQPKDSIGFTGKILNPEGLPLVHTDKFYLPNNTRVDYIFGDEARAFVITSTSTPVSERESLVFTYICYKFGRVGNRLARRLLPAYTRKVIQQDVEIMANQGESLRHHGAPVFTHTEADALHVHIEALRDWATRDEGPPPAPVTERITFWI